MTAARETTHPNEGAFPEGVSGPALRALHVAGIQSKRDLTRWSEADLAKLHGMGPKAIGVLREAMAEEGLKFRRES